MQILIFILNLLSIATGSFDLPKYIGRIKKMTLEISLLAINLISLIIYEIMYLNDMQIGLLHILFISIPILYLMYLTYSKYHYRSLSLFSIYEGMNKLDEGIMISKSGHVIFQNEAFDELIYELFKTKIRNENVLFKRLDEVKYSVESLESLICVKSNDKIYAFSRYELGDSYVEINSTDVTEEITLIKELKQVLEELNNTEDVLNEYLNNIETLEYEKQKNFIQNKIHNVLSYKISLLNQEVIAKSKYHKKISDDLNDFDFELFDSNKIIESRIAELNDDLNPIGASVSVEGSCPFNLTSDELIFEIIREATTNAIYHGMATNISVKFFDDRLEICNNGIIEDGFKKGKGLTLLEKRCHEKGWRVDFKPEDGFKIIVYYGESL